METLHGLLIIYVVMLSYYNKIGHQMAEFPPTNNVIRTYDLLNQEKYFLSSSSTFKAYQFNLLLLTFKANYSSGVNF